MSGLLRAGCCCVEPADVDCGHCDFTSKYWTITLSGVEPGCTACFENGDLTGWGKTTDMTGLDGVHLLTQQPGDSCVWEKENFGTWEFEIHNDANCDDVPPFDTLSGSFSIYLTRTATSWILQVMLTDTLLTERRAFYDIVAEDTDQNCTTIATMTNELVCLFIAPFVFDISDSGNATFEVGDQT